MRQTFHSLACLLANATVAGDAGDWGPTSSIIDGTAYFMHVNRWPNLSQTSTKNLRAATSQTAPVPCPKAGYLRHLWDLPGNFRVVLVGGAVCWTSFPCNR
jgi:hypothetical protein